MNSARDKFLDFYNQELSPDEESKLSGLFEENQVLRQEYAEFVLALEMSKSVGEEVHPLPEGFSEKMLAALEEGEPVLGRSKMKKFFGFFVRFFIGSAVLAVLFFIGSWLFFLLNSDSGFRGGAGQGLINFNQTPTEEAFEYILQMIEGALGALGMVVALFVAFVYAIRALFSSTGKGKQFLRSAQFVSVAMTFFVARSVVSIFFGQNFEGLGSLSENGARPSFIEEAVEQVVTIETPESKPYSPSGEQRFEYQVPPGDSRLQPERDFYDNRKLEGEFYLESSDNHFISASKEALSTFSIDVDTASYSNVRRFLRDNRMPPRKAVRIEEMLNYFDYSYPTPETRDEPFNVVTELGQAPWNKNNKLLHVGLKGYDLDSNSEVPSNLVFLIDVSGSMSAHDKLPLLKKSLSMLVSKLSDQDRVAIVVYAGAAGLVLDSTEGSEKFQIKRALDALSSGGSTAGGAGIHLAYQVAQDNFIKGGNNRVILATDGDFNVGVSRVTELESLITRKRESGVFLSVLGFGSGNLQDGKMETLANKGNGNYFYIDSIKEAEKVLVKEMTSSLFTIAKDVKIQVEFNPANVQAYRLIGYENRRLAKEDFNDDTKDAGELGAGHTVTALYEIVPVGAPSPKLLVDENRYGEVEEKPVVQPRHSEELALVKLRYKKPDGFISKKLTQVVKIGDQAESSSNFKLSAAVAQFGMLLKNSRYKGDSSYESASKLAAESLKDSNYDYVRELIELIDTARLLSDR